MNLYRFVVVAALLTLAAVLQMTAAYALSIGPARPDIVLTTIACVSLLVDMPAAAAAGLWGGLLMATLVSVNFGSFLVSRSVTGALCGWLGEQPIRDGALVAPVAAFAATFLCEGTYYLMAPAHRGPWWLAQVTMEAAYNAALSVPIALALRKAGLRRRAVGVFERG